MKKSIALTKVVGGLKRPNTGRTVTLKDVAGNLIATATETPASSGVYEVNYTATTKYGYWYVDGTLKDAYGNNSPFWLGNYNEISASSALINTVTATTVTANTQLNTPLVYSGGETSLVLSARTGNTNINMGSELIYTDVDFNVPNLYTTGSFTRETPVYNVKAYGAVGNGSANDMVAIQNCINACSASAYGGVVYFPAGEYKTGGGFEIAANMTFKGDGREASKISSINYGAGETFSSSSTTAFFHGVDVDNVVFKDLWIRGVSIDGASSQGIVLELDTASNTAHIIIENVLITDMCSNSALYIDTPILTTLINVKVLRNAGIGFHFVDGTSTDLYECYSITNTEAGFYFDTMTYCVLNGCASEVSGVGFDFKSCSAIVLNGCGTEAILNRYSAFERYAYGNAGTLRDLAYDGSAYRSRNSHIQLNSCYSRDPDVNHTEGTFDKINMREFTLGVTQPRVSYNGNYTSSIEGSGIRTHLSASITAGSTSFTVTSGSGVLFPTGSFYVSIYTYTYSSSYAAWMNSDTVSIYSEVIYVETRIGDVFSGLTRGEYNGTADSWGTTANIELADKYNYAVAFVSGSVVSDVSGYPYRGFHNLGEILLTNIPTDPNNVITGRKLFRSKANGHILYELANISDNTTTTYTDRIPDSALTSSKVAPHRFTANIATDYLSVEENPFVNGDLVKIDYDEDATLPSPLWTSNYYTVTQSSGNDLRLKISGSSTYSDITTTGSGNYFYLYAYQPIDIDIANEYVTIITGSISTASFALTAISASHSVSASSAISASYATNADLLDGKDSTIFATTGSNIFTAAQTISGSITAVSSAFPVAKIIRTSATTNAIRSTLQAIHQTSGDMTDGFGTDLSFGIKDSAGVENEIANIGAFRDGGDSTGALGFYTRVGGTKYERLRISSAGNTYISGSLIISGSQTITGSLTVSGSVTAQNFIGTSSYSTNTELLDGKNSTEFAITGSNVFVGNQIITGSLTVTSGTLLTSVTASIISSSGNIIGNTGSFNVMGIGTTTPTRKVDIYDTGNVPLLIRTTAADYGFIDIDSINGTGTPGVRFLLSGSTKWVTLCDSDDNSYKIIYGSTAATAPKIYISSSGNVGIGTTTPAAPLHIYNASDGVLLRAQGSSGGWQVSASGEVFTMGAYGASDETAIRAGTIGERIRITDTGYVGIGTTVPTTTLYVSGSVIDTVTIDNSNSQYALRLNGSGKYLRMGALNSSYFHIDTDASLGIYFYDGIYVGSNNHKLNTISSTGDSYLVVTSSQNLAIGKTTANTKLDISGNALISGSLNVTGSVIIKSSLVVTGSTELNSTQVFDTLFLSNNGDGIYLADEPTESGLYSSNGDQKLATWDSSNTYKYGNGLITHYGDTEGTTIQGTLSVTGSFHAQSYYVTSSLNTAPASISASGTVGEIRYTADYIYICTGSNAWARTALTKTW